MVHAYDHLCHNKKKIEAESASTLVSISLHMYGKVVVVLLFD
jgi:hypothetical protein